MHTLLRSCGRWQGNVDIQDVFSGIKGLGRYRSPACSVAWVQVWDGWMDDDDDR